MRFTTLFLALSLAGLAVVSSSSSVAAAQSIGFIDVQKILSSSNPGRIARDLLEKTSLRAKTKLEGQRNELEAMQKKYQSQKSVLKPDAREKLEQAIVEKQMALRQDLQRSSQDLQNRDAELTASILDDLKPIIDKLAKERGLSVVMEKGESGVLYAQDKYDLTDVVLKRYDASKK